MLPLWKRCRALAHRLRLEMLTLLADNEPLCVKRAAEQLNIAEEVACKNLQILTLAGLVTPVREGKFLYHTLARGDVLLDAILEEKRDPEQLMYTATALTHERRVVILRELGGRPMTFDALYKQTGMSAGSVRRQLDKLASRDFVRLINGRYFPHVPRDRLGRCLVEMVLNESTPAQV